MESNKPEAVELLPREKGFVCRILQKYPGGQHRDKDLLRSIVIFCLMIAAAHAIEQLMPTRWLALLMILPPALFMFTRYRKFSIFRSCVLSKIAGRLAQYEDLSPPRGGPGTHPHARRAAVSMSADNATIDASSPQPT